jgi:hypothetical protein
MEKEGDQNGKENEENVRSKEEGKTSNRRMDEIRTEE